ncbi:unnamed protein product [Penicillium glandicola]
MATNTSPIATFQSPFPKHFYAGFSIQTLGGRFVTLAQNDQTTFFLIIRDMDWDHTVRIPFERFVNPCIEIDLPISSARFIEDLATSGGVSFDKISQTVACVYMHWLGTSLDFRPGDDNGIKRLMRYLERALEAQARGDILPQELNVEVILT